MLMMMMAMANGGGGGGGGVYGVYFTQCCLSARNFPHNLDMLVVQRVIKIHIGLTTIAHNHM